MSSRNLTPSRSLLYVSLAAIAVLLPAPGSSQEIPRTPDGRPDLQGNWTNATITPLQRPEGQELILSWDEVAELEGRADARIEAGFAPSDPNRAPPEVSSTTGTYNEVFWDRGSRIAIVDGEPRSSLITNPRNGRRPALTPEGEQRAAERRDFRAQFQQYDHPELRPLAERCIVSFGMSAGPPMTPNRAYNNNYTIVQTANHVMIMAEMVHDVRIIRIGEPDRLPRHVKPYFGDSWGRWEGDALVVETTNLNPDHPFQGVIPTHETRVIERFSRADDDSLLYEFQIEDPSNYTQLWGGQIPFERFDDLVHEYNCHEGNYALTAVLSGARYQESQGTAGRD